MKKPLPATVHIKDLRVSAVIGTLPDERIHPQELSLEIWFDYDASLAAETDAMGHAVDYAAVHAKVVETVSSSKYFLLERLAAVVLGLIMEDARVLTARVSIEKFGVLSGSKSVVLTLWDARTFDKSISTTRCY